MAYRYVNMALEGFSILICLLLLTYQFIESRSESKSSKWFTAMIGFNIGMLVGDIITWLFDGKPGELAFYLQEIFGIIVYFACSGLLLFSLYGWIISCISLKKKISSVWMGMGIAFSSMQVLLAVTMPIHKICYIGSDNVYRRGDLFFLTQLPYVIYILAIVLLVVYHKAFKKKELVYMTIFISFPVAAEILQVISSKIFTFNVVTTAGLILVLTFIQAQREYDNEQTIKNIIIKENKKLEQIQVFQENFSEQLIEVLCSALEAKDEYTRGHSLRVAQYAREIVYRMGGTEEQQQEAYYIGILHDVGKFSIADEIINKIGRLTDEEYEIIKLHTLAGYQILRDVTVIPNLAFAARWHHERYDGTGYPNGLKGEDIPQIARIISVADAYDAMTSNRSYHEIMPQYMVRKEIEDGMGTQFDPEIARIMLDMIDDDLQYEMRQVNINKAIYILLVDKDPIVHKMIRTALIDENYMITSAYSGEEAEKLLQESKYDLCILDMKLPDTTGEDVIEWIHEHIRKLKVIFMMQEKDRETIHKCEELGARDYISKPINLMVLREIVNSVLIH